MLLIVSVAFPMFWILALCGGLVVPTTCVPKEMNDGKRPTFGAGVKLETKASLPPPDVAWKALMAGNLVLSVIPVTKQLAVPRSTAIAVPSSIALPRKVE